MQGKLLLYGPFFDTWVKCLLKKFSSKCFYDMIIIQNQHVFRRMSGTVMM